MSFYIRLFCLLMILLLPISGNAFNGKEHVDLSNDAIDLAIEYLKKYPLKNTCPEEGEYKKKRIDDVKKVLTSFKEGDWILKNGKEMTKSKGKYSYSNFVRYVDSVKSPFEWIKMDVESACVGQADCNLDKKFLKTLPDNYMTSLDAAHQNHAHFQKEAMYSFWWWHKQAIAEAYFSRKSGACPKNSKSDHTYFCKCEPLRGAFLLSAYADHFLQDYFAPGHTLTPRSLTSDMYSLAIHDRYNKKGHLFQVTNCDRIINICNQVKKSLALKTDREKKLKERLVCICPDDNVKEIGTLMLYGDDYLDKSEDQRIFIALVCARSILDVAETYIHGEIKNHFTSFTWEEESNSVKKAEIAFGNYVFNGDRKSETTTAKLDETATDSKPKLKVESGRYDIKKNQGPESTAGEADKTTVDSDVDLILNFNFLYQGLRSSSETDDRFSFELDFSSARFFLTDKNLGLDTAHKFFPKHFMIGASLGYSFVLDQDYGHGPIFKIPINFNKINCKLIPLAGYRWYTGGPETSGKPLFGVRAGFGLGPVYFLVGVSWEHRLGPGNTLEEALVYTSGLSFEYPALSLFNWTSKK